MSDVRISELICEERSYEELRDRLHPDGLSCPNGHLLPDDQSPHDRSRAPLVSFRCRTCGSVFNIFTDTAWCGTHFDCTTILLVLRGFERDVPPKSLADVVDVSYSSLVRWKRRLDAAQRRGVSTGLQSDEEPSGVSARSSSETAPSH